MSVPPPTPFSANQIKLLNKIIMKRIKNLLFLLGLLIAIPLHSQDEKVIDRIIDLGITEPKVMEHIDVLTNRFGDRITGSDSYYIASKWARDEMRSWGMMAEMQVAGELPVGYNQGPYFGKMVYPSEMALDFGTPAYTSGTKGKQKGHVVISPANVDEFWEMKDTLKGAWVLIEGTNTGWPRDRGGKSELTRLMKNAGALGTIQLATFPIRLLYGRVESWEELPELPDIKLIDTQYEKIREMVEEGEKVELEFDIRNYFRPGPIKFHNVIGWIPGTEKPDEYVILGGHLDGFTGGTSAVDNASGVGPSMEAARLIMEAGGKPKRTIMVHLWAAEEFGLIGSREWVMSNPQKLPRISMMINRDYGTNAIAGMSVPEAMMDDMAKVTEPILDMHPDYPFELSERTRKVRKGGRGGTDTHWFLQRGVPAFGFQTRGEHSYGRTWHTNLDTYNELIPENLEYSSMVTAVVAYGIANLDNLLSREGLFMDDGLYADVRTNKGTFSILLDKENAPMTVANFVGLAEGNITNAAFGKNRPFFDGSKWHRVVDGHVIQAGIPVIDPGTSEERTGNAGYNIPNEISGLSHDKAGMVGMANAGPHTNSSQWYVTLDDRSYLDGNYTIFGEVVTGMNVVNDIEQGDTIYTVNIVRAGEEWENYRMNDELFNELVNKQWRKVKHQEQMRRSKEEKIIEERYPGLQTSGSGLQYKIIRESSGAEVTEGAEVTLSYKGRLIEGVKFVSSSDNGKPVRAHNPSNFTWTAGEDAIIEGLQEAVMDMREGEVRLLVVPSSLAYGTTGFYGEEVSGRERFVISPGETLILEVTARSVR